jgi:hypothetical protein
MRHLLTLVITFSLVISSITFAQPGRWSEPYNISDNEWGLIDPDMEAGLHNHSNYNTYSVQKQQ